MTHSKSQHIVMTNDNGNTDTLVIEDIDLDEEKLKFADGTVLTSAMARDLLEQHLAGTVDEGRFNETLSVVGALIGRTLSVQGDDA